MTTTARTGSTSIIDRPTLEAFMRHYGRNRQTDQGKNRTIELAVQGGDLPEQPETLTCEVLSAFHEKDAAGEETAGNVWIFFGRTMEAKPEDRANFKALIDFDDLRAHRGALEFIA